MQNEAVIRELQEQEERKPNAIFYKIPESESESSEQRKSDDLNKLQEIGRLCNEEIKPEDVLKIVRIGKKDGSGNPRPTLVKFVNHEKKRKLFRNLHKLSGAKSALKVVNANHDLTKDQRARERI